MLSTVTFQWLEKDFLGYLDDWEKSVKERNGFTDEEKKRMTLSQETLDGLRMTGRPFFQYACKYCKPTHLFFSVFIC